MIDARNVFLLILSGAWIVSAQTALTGALQGTVSDPSGAPLAQARVELTNPQLHIRFSQVTGPDGAFRFLRLTPGADYEVQISCNNFETWQATHLEIPSGEVVSLNVTVKLASRSEAVVIEASPSAIATDSAELSTTIPRRLLQTLPTNGRILTQFALLDARVRNANALGGDGLSQYRLSINANIFRDSQHRLDGNTNYDTLFNNIPLQRVPLSSVQEFRVLTNQFNAEHGSTSAGLTITTTRSGSDQYHGELFLLARPSGMQARPPLANRRVPNQLLQEGGAVGGPLARQKLWFFGSYERTDRDRGSFVTTVQPGFYVGRYTDNVGLLKMDYRRRDDHLISWRLNVHRDTNTNTNDRVGGLVQPSAATLSTTQGVGGQISESRTWGNLVNELRAGYVNAVPSNTAPQRASVVIQRPGYSTEGAASFSMVRTEVYQLADQLSWQRGAHTIKAGADFIRRKVRDRQFDLFGTYTFPAGPPTPGMQPILYTQRFGVAQLTYGQTQWAAFLQDTWRVSSRLTLNLGLRYDYQSIVDDYNNLGPRAGFNWDIRGDGKTVVRGGFGLYYDQPFFHGLSQRFLLNALNAPFTTISLAPGDPAFPTFPFSFSPLSPPPSLNLAPRNVVLRGDQLLNPYTTQFTLGVQRELAREWVLAVDVTRTLTVKQFLHFDINAPAPFPRSQPGQARSIAEADRTRPLYDPSLGVSVFRGVPVREVRVTGNGGNANYHALTVNLTRRFAGRYFAGVSYNWASAMNSITDDHLGANPQDWSDVRRAERARSDFLQRHRLVAHAGGQLPWRLMLSGIYMASSGLPVNALTGVDNNGDGLLRDRPPGMGRNAFTGTPMGRFDVALLRTFALSESLSLELRAEGFNLMNHQNYYVFNNIYGNGATASASFLRPLAGVANVDPARQFHLGLRLQF